jgi:ethanolamine utilization protein EutM
MTQESLGLIETIGLAAAIEAADAALKSANVVLVGYELTRGDGMVLVKVQGEVGAVNAAVAAGVAAAAKVSRVASSRVVNAATVGSPSALAACRGRSVAEPASCLEEAETEGDVAPASEAPSAHEPQVQNGSSEEDLSGTSADSVSESDARNPDARDSLAAASVAAQNPDHRDAVSPLTRLANEKLPTKNRKQRKTKE